LEVLIDVDGAGSKLGPAGCGLIQEINRGFILKIAF